MDIAGLFPSYINIRRGAYISLIISIALCPWQLLASASTFISVLSAYSVFLGPMTGVMICDYWVVRRRKLKLSDLYYGDKDGVFYFWHGINWRSFAAWICGWSYLIPGLLHAVNSGISVPIACTRLYYLAFPLSFVVSFLIYYGLNLVSPLRVWESSTRSTSLRRSRWTRLRSSESSLQSSMAICNKSTMGSASMMNSSYQTARLLWFASRDLNKLCTLDVDDKTSSGLLDHCLTDFQFYEFT